MHGSPAHGGYDRKVPSKYSTERDDRLMNSVISNYAREVKVNGQLTGQFFLNKKDAKRLYQEHLDSHAAQYGYNKVDNNFEQAWNHFDVNHDGLVEAERAPQFLRYDFHNALDIDLQ